MLASAGSWMGDLVNQIFDRWSTERSAARDGSAVGWPRRAKVATAAAVVALMGLLVAAPAFAANIQTDLFVYQDGDTVTVTGDGFGTPEAVDFTATDPNGT